jgi:hypothetical protein
MTTKRDVATIVLRKADYELLKDQAHSYGLSIAKYVLILARTCGDLPIKKVNN